MNKPNSGRQVDMLHGPMAIKMIAFALPIAATSVLQQLFNSVDVAVVGHYVGTGALAAVGTNTAVIALFINCLVSLSVGATVVIAHLIGEMEPDSEEHKEKISRIVHTSILFSIFCGMGMLIMGQLIAGPILRMIGAPEDILADAILYLKIYFLAAPAIMVYNFLSAIMRSIGDTRKPLYILIASGVLNVVLNLLLVIVFHRGVDGVAIATVVSNLFSAVVLWIVLMREKSLIRLEMHKLTIDGKSLKRVLQIGGPASLQGIFFCFSNICVQSGINSLGSAAVAAASAGQMFINFSFYIITGFSQATLAFAGQNYGAGEEKRCKQVLYLGMVEAICFTMLFVSGIMLARYQVLRLFTDDVQVTELAILQMKITLVPYFLVAVYEIIGAWMRARGHSLEPALVVIAGSVFFRILWLNTAFRWTHTFSMLFLVYPISWALTICIMTAVCVILTKKDSIRQKTVR